MSRVITFSRHFPAKHPKVGQPTHFVEKIWNGIFTETEFSCAADMLKKLNHSLCYRAIDAFIMESMVNVTAEKYHTIRNGNRWKVGDKFSPRVWSGRPYASKMITIAPDIEIKKVWDIRVLVQDFGKLGKQATIHIGGILLKNMDGLSRNDGLSAGDMAEWLYNKKEQVMVGQIICWNPSIEY